MSNDTSEQTCLRRRDEWRSEYSFVNAGVQSWKGIKPKWFGWKQFVFRIQEITSFMRILSNTFEGADVSDIGLQKEGEGQSFPRFTIGTTMAPLYERGITLVVQMSLKISSSICNPEFSSHRSIRSEIPSFLVYDGQNFRVYVWARRSEMGDVDSYRHLRWNPGTGTR